MSKIKKYCEGLDCAICDEKEPCIYKIANDLQEQLKRKEQKLDKIKEIIDYYSSIYCSKCKHYKTCTSIDDCVNTITKELLQIIGGKENG